MLTVQYRMHELISAWISGRLYESRLRAHESVARHTLAELEGVRNDENTSAPLVLVDTEGCEMRESVVVAQADDKSGEPADEESSKANEGEANIVCRHVNELVEAGLKPESIGVITPYNLQMELIKAKLQAKYPLVRFRNSKQLILSLKLTW